MIKYIDGDLVRDAENYDVIVHCCNCFCTMGAGIAPQIKNKFPEAYAVDCETKAGDVNKLGTITHTVTTKPTIVNIYSQYGTRGRQKGEIDLDYDALRKGLQLTKDKFSGKRFGFPYIGTGLAGGDEKIVLKMIEDIFIGEYVTLVRYNPTK